MSIKKKIMIIEDQALLNNMMQKLLSNDYDIVCTCTSAKEMMNLYKIYTPDLILTDVVTKDGANGIYYGKKVKEKYGKKVKILSSIEYAKRRISKSSLSAYLYTPDFPKSTEEYVSISILIFFIFH